MEPRVRLGHKSTYCEVLVTYIIWDYILPQQNLWSCLYLYLWFPSFLKCRPFLLWKINPPHMFLLHFVQDLVLPSLLISLHSRISAFVLQTCLTISPNIQKYTLALHISLQLPLHFSVGHFNNIFQKNQLHELWSHILTCHVQASSSSLAFSPLLYCSNRGPLSMMPVLARPVALFSSHPGRAPPRWPNWPVLPAGNALRFTSVPTQTHVFSFPQSTPHLSHFCLFLILPNPGARAPYRLTSAFLSLNAHSNDITHCLDFKYYSCAFPSLCL